MARASLYVPDVNTFRSHLHKATRESERKMRKTEGGESDARTRGRGEGRRKTKSKKLTDRERGGDVIARNRYVLIISRFLHGR